MFFFLKQSKEKMMRVPKSGMIGRRWVPTLNNSNTHSVEKWTSHRLFGSKRKGANPYRKRNNNPDALPEKLMPNYGQHISKDLRLPPEVTVVCNVEDSLLGQSTFDMQKEGLKELNQLWMEHYHTRNNLLVYMTEMNLKEYESMVKDTNKQNNTSKSKKHAQGSELSTITTTTTTTKTGTTMLMKPDCLLCRDGLDLYWLRNVSNQSLYLSFANKKDKNDENDEYHYCKKDMEWHNRIKKHSHWNQDSLERICDEFRISNHQNFQFECEEMRILMEFSNEMIVQDFRVFINDRLKKQQQSSSSLSIGWNMSLIRNQKMKYSITPDLLTGKRSAIEWILQRCQIIKSQNDTSNKQVNSMTMSDHNVNNDEQTSMNEEVAKSNPLRSVIICSHSDPSLFQLCLDPTYQSTVSFKGILLQNSDQELRAWYQANKEHSQGKLAVMREEKVFGLVEGLQHFSL